MMLLLLGCAIQVDVLLTPDGDTVTGPWVTIIANLQPRSQADLRRAELDGDPWDTEWVRSARYNGLGGGTDWITQLDLAPVDDFGLEPGEHTIRVESRWFDGTATFDYERGDHELIVDVVDPDGDPLDARVFLHQAGEPVLLFGPDEGDPKGRDHGLSSLFTSDGRARHFLDAGTYEILVVRDLRWELGHATVDLDDDQVIQVVLEPGPALSGWWSADLHVHTALSSDSFLPDPIRRASLRAAGLDVFVITDHDEVRSGFGQGIRGMEHTLRDCCDDDGGTISHGHLNAWPLDPDERELDNYLLLGDAVAAFHERGATVQLNHPRGLRFFPDERPYPGGHALFNSDAYGFDPDAPIEDVAWLPVALDAIEVLNRYDLDIYLEVRDDWFALLRGGVRITATGNSDTHALEVERAGFPSTWVQCDDPGVDCLEYALGSGRAQISTGLFVDMQVCGATRCADIGETLDQAVERVDFEVLHPDWVPADAVHVWVDGELVERVEVEPGPQSVDIRCEDACFVVLEAWGEREGDYAVLLPELTPMALTNPVWVEP
jgi:hypothetical protein